MGNSARIADSSRSPLFKKASVRRRELTRYEIPRHIEDLSQEATRFLKYILDKGVDLIKEFTKDPDERKNSIMCLVYLSITSTVAHIIIQGGIMSKYVYEDIFGLMTAFLCMICLFAFFNFCLISPFSSLLGKPSCLVENLKRRLVFYFISLSLYLGLLYDVASFLRKNDSDHFIGSLIISSLCINVHGILVLLTSVVYFIHKILYWCCMILLFFITHFCCNSEEVKTNPTIYLYDPSKTEEKTCTICLQEYKKLDEIRICKAHHIHIFHEKCISDCLLRRPICPLCNNNQPARFH